MAVTELKQGNSESRTTISHFWASTDPFFTTRLYVVPGETEAESAPVRLTLFDPDGEKINDAFVEIAPGGIGSFDLAEFMTGCKREGGFLHAHVQAQCSRSVSYTFRIEGDQSASLLGKPSYVKPGQAAFFPVFFDEARSIIFGAVNCSGTAAQLDLTLSFQNSRFNVTKEIPPFGSRVMSVRSEFQHVNFRNDKVAYLECSCNQAGSEIGVQMIEEVRLADGSRVYHSLT